MRNGNPRTRRRGAGIVALALSAVTWGAPATWADAAADAAAGEQIFQQKCAACHTVGRGDLVGPDLKGVSTQRPRDWLQHWLAAPDQMLAQKDPVATALLHRFHDVPMPNLGLSAAEVDAVLAYLESAAAGVAASAPGTPAPSASAAVARGDAAIGKDLFMGTMHFRNGGPPCMACHSVAGIGALGGGQLGPDLTSVFTRYGGAAGVDAFVAGSPTPTMRAVWAQQPATAQERADLVAFLAQAPLAQRPAQAIWQLAALALAGAALLFAIAGWIWRQRLPGVRRPLLARQRQLRGPSGARTH